MCLSYIPELTAENAHLKETLSALQMQKTADKEHLRGLQTTLQKLNETVAVLEEQKQLDKNYMKGMHEMVEEVTNEKNSLSNRVSRLSQENEQLLGDCRKTDSILRQLNDSLGQHQQQVQQLQHMCEQQKAVNTDLRKQHASEVARNDQLAAQLLGLQTKCSSHENKIKLYRTKLVDFSGQLKELRMCKEVLLTTVREYSEAVNKWQGEILTVSNNFFVKNRVLQDENRLLEERLSSAAAGSCGQCAETMQKYEELVMQFEKMVQDNLALGALVKDIEKRQESDMADGSDEKTQLIDEIRSKNDNLEQHKEDDLLVYRVTLVQLDESLQSVQNEINRLQDFHKQERDLHAIETSKLQALVSELTNKLEQNEKQAEHKIEIDFISQTLALKEVEIESKNEENQNLQAKLTELNREIKSHLEQINLKDESQMNLELQVSELEGLVDSLRNTLDTDHSEYNLCQENPTKLSEHISQSNDNKLESLKNAIEQAKLKIESHKLLESKILELENDLEILRNSSKSIQHELDIKDEKIQNLQAELTAELISHKDEAHSKQENLHIELESLQSNLALSQAQITEKIESHNALEITNSQLKNELECLRKQIEIDDQSKSELESLQIDLSKAHSELHAKEEINQTLDTKITGLKSELMSLRSNLASQQAQVNAKEKAIHTLETMINQKEATITEYGQQIQDLQTRFESMKCELITSQSQIASQNDALSKKSAEQSQNEQTMVKIQDKLKEQHLELSASKMCVDDLRSQLKKAKDASCSQESTELVSLQARNTELTNTIQVLKQETSEANENLATAKSTFEKALLERDASLKDSQKQFDDKSQRLLEQSEAIQQLRQDSTAQIRTLEQRIDSGQKAIVELQTELKDAEQKMTALQSQFEQSLGDKENVIQSKQMEMDELLSEMRELNEALRNRGDIISKQEQKIAGLNAELTDKVSHVERLVVEHEQLNEKLREADSIPRMHGKFLNLNISSF